MKKYTTPDFDITIYEIDDILTASRTEPPKFQIGNNNNTGDSIDWDQL